MVFSFGFYIPHGGLRFLLPTFSSLGVKKGVYVAKKLGAALSNGNNCAIMGKGHNGSE